MLRIAIISDIHGNLPALTTVLNDIENREIDQVYCLGDLVDFAPWSNEVIEEIRTRKIPCLMGNHDERVAFDQPVVPLLKHTTEETKARIIAIEHSKTIINSSNQSYLSTLPSHITLDFLHGTRAFRILMVHGSVRSNDEYIYEDHPEDDLRSMLLEKAADVLVMGHTHVPYIRYIPQLIVNCGSVGRSKEDVRYATYATLTIDNNNCVPEIFRIEYNTQETVDAIMNSDIPDFYAAFLKTKPGEQ